jgi:hypothetical protein
MWAVTGVEKADFVEDPGRAVLATLKPLHHGHLRSRSLLGNVGS